MKPDWKDAPEWANYLAQDESGDWYWFENKPIVQNGYWMFEQGDCDLARPTVGVWQESLEQRP